MRKWTVLAGPLCFVALIISCGEEAEPTKPDKPSGEQYLLWTFQAGDAIEQSPWVENGRVYLSSENGKIYCLHAETGRQIWTYQTGDRVVARPTLHDGKVYVGSWDKKLYCLDAQNGKLIWWEGGEDMIYTTACVHDNRVFFGDFDGYFECIPIDSGRHWTFRTFGGFFGTPCGDSGYVYATSSDGYVRCFDTEWEWPEWEYDTGSSNYSSPWVENSRVYVGGDYNLLCLNAKNGGIIWYYETKGADYCSPRLVNGKVYVGDYGNCVYCLTGDGKLVWQTKIGRDFGRVQSRPLVRNGKVYVGSTDGAVACLNEADGKVFWKYETGAQVVADPWFYDGKMYIGSGDGKLYCFKAS